MRRANIIAGLTLLGLGLSGCFSLDSNLIGDAGDVPPPDSGAAEPDADVVDDAAPEHEDAGADEASVAAPDGDAVSPVPTECDADAPCAMDEFCGVSAERRVPGTETPARVCKPRCSAELGCLLGEIDRRVSDLAVVNRSLLILTKTTRDSLGNPRNDQELLRWDRPAAPASLVRGTCESLVHVSDTLVFCVDRAGILQRLPIIGAMATPERLSEDRVDAYWATSTHVWFSVRTNELKALSRVSLAGTEAPQRMSSEAAPMWLAGSERAIYFAVSAPGGGGLLLYTRSPTFADEPRSMGPFHAYEPYAVADQDALYFNTSYDSSTIMRTPLDGGATTKLSNQNSCGGTFDVSGPHVYWQCTSSGASGKSVLRIARNLVAPPGEPQILVDAPIAFNGGYGSARSFAVLEHSIVYIHPDDDRLFEVSF